MSSLILFEWVLLKNPYQKSKDILAVKSEEQSLLKKEVTYTPDRKALTGVIPIVTFIVCFF